MQQRIVVESRGPKIRVIRFNCPERKNAFNLAAYKDLQEAIRGANDDPVITTVVLIGSGDFFSSGNDLKAAMEEMNDDPKERIAEGNRLVSELVEACISFRKLLIAVCNGPAIGISATILPLCDVVYATKDVRP